MATVHLDGGLREYVPARTIRSQADSVERLLDELDSRYPKLRHRIRDETRTVRRFVRVFVNGTDIRALDGTGTALAASDSVDILHSIQGG